MVDRWRAFAITSPGDTLCGWVIINSPPPLPHNLPFPFSYFAHRFKFSPLFPFSRSGNPRFKKNKNKKKRGKEKPEDQKTHVCQAGIKDNSFWKSVKYARSIYSTYIRVSTMRREKSPVVEVEGVDPLCQRKT